MKLKTFALLFATAAFCSVVAILSLLNDGPHPHTRRVYAAENVWLLENAHIQGTASPVVCRQVNDKWVVTFITAKHLILGIKDEWTISRNEQTLIEGKMIAQHALEDAALIVFTSATYIDIIPLESRSPLFGEEVWAVGYPGVKQPIITQGIVSHLFIASASSYYGCSGGPVIDSRGRVIGIVVGIFRDILRGISVRHIMKFTPIVSLDEWLTTHNISHDKQTQ